MVEAFSVWLLNHREREQKIRAFSTLAERKSQHRDDIKKSTRAWKRGFRKVQKGYLKN